MCTVCCRDRIFPHSSTKQFISPAFQHGPLSQHILIVFLSKIRVKLVRTLTVDDSHWSLKSNY